jgi:hypothetical protein
MTTRPAPARSGRQRHSPHPELWPAGYQRPLLRDSASSGRILMYGCAWLCPITTFVEPTSLAMFLPQEAAPNVGRSPLQARLV